MKSLMHHIGYSLLLPLLLASGHVQAERMFKWVDEEGNIHYSDRVPPQHAKQERREYDVRGKEVRVYERARTPEEKAEAARLAAIEEAKKREAEKKAVHDRSLLATYSSEEDMLMARDGKLASVDALIQLTRSRIESTETRLREYAAEAAEFERSGKPVPNALQDQIKTARDLITENREFVREKEIERETIAAQFDADIDRYRELTEDDE
jgi:hypothetical protein